ncbi:TPA: transposase [Streptococcus suis]|nr:transposase [Streptococcus suis]HEM6023773.1 transposase [Streptococcus suis]HEM6039214.1 transposase [Streptococcus suis]
MYFQWLTQTLRSGAGLEPSLCNNESSDKKGSSKIRHGNSYLKKCLCRPAFTVKKALESRL